jgi:hypothetical protein
MYRRRHFRPGQDDGPQPTGAPVPGASGRACRIGGFMAALAAVSVWAGWIPPTRLGVVTRLAPRDVAALRVGASGLILAPLLMQRYREVPCRRWPTLLMLVAGAGMQYRILFTHGS